jgi:alkylation response protein AidB-like acyl-CoA dehydrogenase
VPKSQILGQVHQGFEVANSWLGATRLQVAATCLGRAERALDLAMQWSVERKQFGQQIGKFQGVSFKLADMAMELRAAELLTLDAAWKFDQGLSADVDMAMAQLKATEVLAMVADEALRDPRRHGSHVGSAARAHLARCAHRAYLGRHQ